MVLVCSCLLCWLFVSVTCCFDWFDVDVDCVVCDCDNCVIA